MRSSSASTASITELWEGLSLSPSPIYKPLCTLCWANKEIIVQLFHELRVFIGIPTSDLKGFYLLCNMDKLKFTSFKHKLLIIINIYVLGLFWDILGELGAKIQ